MQLQTFSKIREIKLNGSHTEKIDGMDVQQNKERKTVELVNPDNKRYTIPDELEGEAKGRQPHRE